MRKIAIALSKGGVGKTTTAYNLAAGLALAGQRVLLADLDTQGQIAKALGVSPEYGLADLVDGVVSPEDAILEARPNLWLLAGGPALAGLKRTVKSRTICTTDSRLYVPLVRASDVPLGVDHTLRTDADQRVVVKLGTTQRRTLPTQSISASWSCMRGPRGGKNRH